MSIPTFSAAVVAALFVTGCGAESQMLTTPTPVTRATVAPTVISLPLATVTPGAASCSDGSVPAHLFASVHSDTATLSWDAVPAITDYRLAVEYLTADNAYVPVLTVGEDHLQRDVTPGAGRYRARVGTRVCDTVYGPWSAWVYFAIDDGDARSGPVAPITSAPQPPTSTAPPALLPPTVTVPVVPVQPPSATLPPVVTPAPTEGDHDRGHGNDPGHDDPDNPGKGKGGHGAK